MQQRDVRAVADQRNIELAEDSLDLSAKRLIVRRACSLNDILVKILIEIGSPERRPDIPGARLKDVAVDGQAQRTLLEGDVCNLELFAEQVGSEPFVLLSHVLAELSVKLNGPVRRNGVLKTRRQVQKSRVRI